MIRLYPLYALGTAIGLVSAVAALALGQGELSLTGLIKAAGAAVFMVPSPTADETGGVFPLNAPGWSLFFEIFVNVVFVAIGRRLSNALLVALIAASAIGMAAMALYFGHVDMGSAWVNFWGGFPRVMVTFFSGVFICRLHNGSTHHGWVGWLLPFAVLPIFLPDMGVGVPSAVYGLACVFILFPALIWAGASFEPTAKGVPLFRWLGMVSFPLYAVHFPVLLLAMRALGMFEIPAVRFAPTIGVFIAAGLLAATPLLVKLYDAPVRSWLMRRLAA